MFIMHVLLKSLDVLVAEFAFSFCCWLYVFGLLMPVFIGHKISLFRHAIFGVVCLYMFC